MTKSQSVLPLFLLNPQKLECCQMESGRTFHCQNYRKSRKIHVSGRMGTETAGCVHLMSLLDYQTRPSKSWIDHHCMMANVSRKNREVGTLKIVGVLPRFNPRYMHSPEHSFRLHPALSDASCKWSPSSLNTWQNDRPRKTLQPLLNIRLVKCSAVCLLWLRDHYYEVWSQAALTCGCRCGEMNLESRQLEFYWLVSHTINVTQSSSYPMSSLIFEDQFLLVDFCYLLIVWVPYIFCTAG